MTSSVLISPRSPIVKIVDVSKVGMAPIQTQIYGVQRLPTDPIGSTTVTFDGVHAGSEIRVQFPDLSEAAGVETCDYNHVLTWSVYASGSANNTVRIVIVHPDYKIKEFSYTSRVGAQSLPVQQEPDKWYSNPA